jgi:hypothetical protein
MVDDFERSKQEFKELLRSIRSIDDLKEKKDELIDTQEKFMVSAVVTAKNFFDNLPSYTPEEKKAQVERFSDEKFIFDDEIDAEMIRIYELPECGEFMDSIEPEMMAKVEPPMTEFMGLMQTKMMEVMGDMMGVVGATMGAMAEGMGAVAEGFQEMVEEPEEEYYEPSREVKDLTYQLPHYLRLHTLDDLKNEKDDMLVYIDELLGDKLENIKSMKEMEFPRDEIVDDMKLVMKMRTITKDEVGKLMDRIAKRSGDVEYINSVKQEFATRLDPIEVQIKELKRFYARN